MKVWLVGRQEYDESVVMAVMSSEEAAEEYKKRYEEEILTGDDKTPGYKRFLWIEEKEVWDSVPAELKSYE